eukprot:Ihof_evm9s167 gene=Ihof_evmTU9s167
MTPIFRRLGMLALSHKVTIGATYTWLTRGPFLCWNQRYMRTHLPPYAKNIEAALFSQKNKAHIDRIYDTSVPTSSVEDTATLLAKRYQPWQQEGEVDIKFFPYYIHPTVWEELESYSRLHFHSPSTAIHLATLCPTASGVVLLQTLRKDTELYQETLAKALAQEFKAGFLPMDSMDFIKWNVSSYTKPVVKQPPPVININGPFAAIPMPNLQVRKVNGGLEFSQVTGSDIPDDIGQFEITLKAIFEALNASVIPKESCVIFFRNFPEIFNSEARMKALNKELMTMRKDRGVVVVGSTCPSQEKKVDRKGLLMQKLLGDDEDEEKEERGDGLDVNGVCNVWLHEPPYGPLRDAWLRQLAVDTKVVTQRDNHRRIAKVVDQLKIAHDPLSSVEYLDQELLDPTSIELLVLWALGQYYCAPHSQPTVEAAPKVVDQLNDNGTKKGVKAPVFMGADSLKKALNLLLKKNDLAAGQLALRKPHIGLNLENLNRYEKRLLPNVISPGSIGMGFGDIGALDNCKKVLREIITLPLTRPELFSKGLLARSPTGVLLFGPPGTGKTMLAKAVAAESGSNFLHVSMSDIMNKYVGQSEKNAKAVFTLARKMTPCVIFLDEVDSLFSNRESDRYASKREALNEFMQEWDGMALQTGRVLVMAATNRPFDLDEAVIRRLPRRLMVDLPNTDARKKILTLILRNEDLSPTVVVDRLARETKGYTGSDLYNLSM